MREGAGSDTPGQGGLVKKEQKVRKLTLTRETLRSLEEAEAREAAGGFATGNAYSCAPTCARSCHTCFCP